MSHQALHLRAESTHHIRLLPAAPATAAALPPDGIAVTRLPFRVGRKPKGSTEETLGLNDLQLDDRRAGFVSLNHFSIELGPDGMLVRDRGSQRGTIVNGASIGARAKRDTAPLRSGENVVVIGQPRLGGDESPFRLRLIVEG